MACVIMVWFQEYVAAKEHQQLINERVFFPIKGGFQRPTLHAQSVVVITTALYCDLNETLMHSFVVILHTLPQRVSSLTEILLICRKFFGR